MRELFALTIDRATSAEVSRINKEIGRSNQLGYHYHPNASYQHLLQEYVSLKLILHRTRKAMYYRGDVYTEREDVNIVNIRERCAELREAIKSKRLGINYAAWGDLTPWQPTPYDRPVLHAMDEYTCSFVTEDDGENESTCPLQGRHWFHGKPYCRKHMRESRCSLNKERREKKAEAQNRRTWARFVENEIK